MFLLHNGLANMSLGLNSDLRFMVMIRASMRSL